MNHLIAKTCVLVYLTDRNRVLMQHHQKRAESHSYGKYNAITAFVNDRESLAQAANRALIEQAGVEASLLSLRGMVHWSKFGRNKEPLLGVIYLAQSQQRPMKDNHEGPLVWMEKDSLLRSEVPLWPGDHLLLPLVFAENQSGIFDGIMTYANGIPERFEHLWMRPQGGW